MKKKALYSVISCLMAGALVWAVSGCGSQPVQTPPVTENPSLTYSLNYYHNIDFDRGNGDYVSEEIQQILDAFGASEYFIPAPAETQTYTDIPAFENNAKGTDPICILMPELDISKYRSCSQKDEITGSEISGWYRILGGPVNGMMTDEFITYDLDESGNVTQYQTVNLGKYDALGLDETTMENLGTTFSNAISEQIGSKTSYQYYFTTASQTAFRVFTDTQDRVIITTTVTLTQDRGLLNVDLYAVVNRSISIR